MIKISKSGYRRLSQSYNQDLVNKVTNGAAEGWYFHASDQPLLGIDKGYVTLFVEANDYDDSTHYGNVYNFVYPNSVIEATSLVEEVRGALISDRDAGGLSPDLDSTFDGGMLDQLEEEFNPDDIVDTAGLWDSPEFVSWFYDKFGNTFVKTWDGGVCPVISEFNGTIISMTEEEFESLSDY